MILLIFYIWILDLFLYSNTEIFIIFFIFSSFGVFFYNLVIWYSEYIDQLIVSENKSLYLIIFSLRKKFISLKNKVKEKKFYRSNIHYPVFVKNKREFSKLVVFYKNFYLFSEILYHVNLSKFYFFKYKNYINYSNILLTRAYIFELQQNRNFINSKFCILRKNLLSDFK